jgi:hypothetical protein
LVRAEVGVALGVPGSTVAEAAVVPEGSGTVAAGVAFGVESAAVTAARATCGGSAVAPEDAEARDRPVAPVAVPQMATIAIT